MTATLTYQLPEEATAHLWAVHAPQLAGTLCDLDEALRGWLKHGHTFATPDAALQACRDHLTESMNLARGET
jgi:hypothetical protein